MCFNGGRPWKEITTTYKRAAKRNAANLCKIKKSGSSSKANSVSYSAFSHMRWGLSLFVDNQ